MRAPLGLSHSYFNWLARWVQAGQPQPWDDRRLWSQRPLLLRLGSFARLSRRAATLRLALRPPRCVHRIAPAPTTVRRTVTPRATLPELSSGTSGQRLSPPGPTHICPFVPLQPVPAGPATARRN